VYLCRRLPALKGTLLKTSLDRHVLCCPTVYALAFPEGRGCGFSYGVAGPTFCPNKWAPCCPPQRSGFHYNLGGYGSQAAQSLSGLLSIAFAHRGTKGVHRKLPAFLQKLDSALPYTVFDMKPLGFLCKEQFAMPFHLAVC
jgi:hypothetical protein